MLSDVALRMTLSTLLMCCLFVLAGLAQVSPQSDLIAHYTFNGNAKDDTGLNPDFDLKNTKFVDNTLYLNGLFTTLDARGPGYRAISRTSKLNYRTFSIILRFKLDTPRKGASQPNLLTGGIYYRWFGLRFSAADGGKLIVYFNNGDFASRIESTMVRPEVWTVIACTVDLPNHRVSVYQDGKNVGAIELPQNFVLDALNNDVKGADKLWSFTNYSNADVFHGWVDDLAVYGRVLSDDEVARLTVHLQ